jgi:hypothetical protein
VPGVRIDIARLRDLWIRIGDIEALSRATTSGHRAEDDARRGSAPLSDARDARSRARRPPSLMDGDGYFYVQLRDELRRLYAERDSTQHVPIAERVELVLTATLFEPVRTSVRLNRSTTIEDQRSSAQFRFRHGLVRTDFHPIEDAEREAALARLAMAARTTSSFPFAFEPASIAVGLPVPRRDEVIDALDFTGTFEAPRPPGRVAPQAVIDGGVLDNIPVTAAIRAVAAAPADGPTARRLVYMHPSPPAMSQSGGDTLQLEAEPAPGARVGPRQPSTLRERIAGLGSPRAIKAGIRTLGARFGQESLLADIDELALVNDIAERRRLALEAVFGEYLDSERGGVDLSADSFLRLQENVDRRLVELDKVRADIVAGRIVDALQHPESIGAGRPTANRRTLDRLEATAGRPLRALVCEALCRAGRSGSEPIWRSAVCLEEAALVLVSWARDIERWTADVGWESGADGSMDEVGALKASGYRARAIVELMERRELERWVRSATSLRAAGPAPVDEWAREQAGDTPWLVPSDLAGRVGEALATDQGEYGFPAFVQQLSGKPPATGVDLRPRLWAELVEHAQRLGAAGRLRSPARERRPATVPFRILEQVVAQERLDGLMEAALAAVTRLVLPLQLVGPSENRIEFVQLSGRAPTPVQPRFKALLALRAERTAREAERALTDSDHRLVDAALPAGGLHDDDPLRPSDKLCGDEMGNFAAFLSAKWRANDWMWGRLDAAATLVDLLVSPERLATGAAGADEAVRLAHQAITAAPPGMGNPEAWTTHFTETIWKGQKLEDKLRAALATSDAAAREEAAAALQQAVTTRLHEEVLAAELPVVFGTNHEPDPNWKPAAPAHPDDLEDCIARYDTGLERPKALGDRRQVGMGMRVGLVAFGALRPDGASPVAVFGRGVVSLLKPIYLAILFFALSVRRGLFVTAVAAGALQTTFWQRVDAWKAPTVYQALVFVGGVAVFAFGARWASKDAAEARERRRRRSEWPGRLQVVGGVVAAAVVLNVLWAAGSRYALLFLAAVALGCTAAWLWREQYRQGRAGSLREQIWFPATIVVAVAGIVFGGVLDQEDRPVPGRVVGTAWDSFRPAALLLAGAAVIVAIAGTSWMRGRHRIGAVALTAGAYLGTAAPFRVDDDGPGEWPTWVWVAAIVAAVCVVVALAALAALDAVRRERAVGSPPWSLWVRAAGTVVVPGLVAAFLATRHVSWPATAWAALSIVIAAYALTLYATFADVLNPRPGAAPAVTAGRGVAVEPVSHVPPATPVAVGSPAS